MPYTTERSASLLALQALGRQAFQISRPLLLVPASEFAQICPGEQPGIVAVAEHDPHRIMPDRLKRGDLHMPLARHELPLKRPVSLHLRARRLDAQIFGIELITL